MTRRLSHLDRSGRVKMVDVSLKKPTVRRAVAEAVVRAAKSTVGAATEGRLAKGNVESVVRIAAISAAKRTADLIPLCHPLLFERCEVEFSASGGEFVIRVEVAATGRTGFEMEAMTGAAVGALALYDMIKGIDKGAEIRSVRLIEKSGGKSGTFRR